MGDVRSIIQVPEIDFLIGGSPCQGFSFAGKQLNFEDPRSSLFFEYVRILKSCKPKYFLLENVIMKKDFKDIISKYLGVEPIEINSALVSAQNRRRLYWVGIRQKDGSYKKAEIAKPKDKGILLKDVLTSNGVICRMVGRKINPETGKRDDYNEKIKAIQRLETRHDEKCGALTTVQKDNLLIDISGFLAEQKKNYVQYDIQGKGHGSQDQRAYYLYGKHGTLSASRGGSKCKVYIAKDKIRKLTPVECERLQTLPDNYTDGTSDTQRYKALGNGWTVDVISYIFKEVLF